MAGFLGPGCARPAFTWPVDRAHPLNSGRIAWWLPIPGRMGGPALADLMGSYPASTVGSPAWSYSSPFAGVLLDGSTQYAIAPAAGLANLDNVTVGVRFTPTPAFLAAPAGELIVRQAVPGDGDRGCRIVWVDSGGDRILHTDSRGGYLAQALCPLNAGVETTIVLTIASSTGAGAQYYKDGQPIATNRLVTLPGNDTSGMPFNIGSALGGNPCAALISEAFAYDRILSAAEVAQLCEQSRRGYPDLLRRPRSAALFTLPAFLPWFAAQHATPLGSGAA